MANGSEAWTSRKYRTAWYLTALATLVFVAPMAISYVKDVDCKDFVTGAQWLTFLFGIWSVYFGVNVAEKHSMFIEPTKETKPVKQKKSSKVDNPDEDLEEDGE